MILLLAIVSALVAVASAECENRHYREIPGGGCFRVYTKARTFADADIVCRFDGAHLAAIHNALEEQGVKAILHDEGQSPALIGLQCFQDTCKWRDGTPYDYNSFYGGAPYPQLGDCAALSESDGMWTSTDCNIHHISFICRMEEKIEPSECGDYSLYNGFCVQVKRSPRTAIAADADCDSEGGHLVSIAGESDNTFYKNLLISNGVNGSAHIGLRNSNGDYQWIDGSSNYYRNWAQYFPNSRFGDCVQIMLTNEVGEPGEWINEDCVASYPYICKRKAGAQPTTAPTLSPLFCPNMQLFEDAGTIYSPGYPVSFIPRTRCEYLLTAQTGKQVQVIFPVFNTDNSSSVSLYDGMVATNAFAVLSGNVSNAKTYNTKGNILKMVFKTGNSVSGQGWQANFTTA